MSENKKEILIQLLIIAVGLFFFVPFLGNAFLFDWDEANFGEAAREMLASGNFLQVQINYAPFFEKPPLFFWLQAAFMALFGIGEFAARFVNALCGALTLLIVYRIGRGVFDRRFGLLWAGAFLGSFLPHLFFKSGIIDPVFNLLIFLGIYFVFKSEKTKETKSNSGGLALAGVFIGLATLTKGPVAVLIAVLCVIVYWAMRRFRPFLPLKGVLAAAVACAAVSCVWYGAETLVHGPVFITEFIRYQIRLLTTGDAGHGRPFWFHFVVLLFGCFPVSFLAIRSFFPSSADPDRQKRFTRWMLVLFWVVLILFSIVKTKTVLYSSLCYFPLTYLAAYHLYAVMQGKLFWNRRLTASLAAFGSIVALVIAAFPVIMMHTALLIPLVKDPFARECLTYPAHWSYWETGIGLGYAAALIATVALASKKRFAAGFALLLLSTALCLQSAMILFVPKVENYAGAGPVRFYKSLRGKDVYAKSLFKSYADLFYSQKRPGAPKKSYEDEWLLSGAIDKPAYFVCRIDAAEGYRKMPQLREIKAEYGFVYFVREAVKKNGAEPAGR
jgi:4-amino-4-deoxy-L-arabinose transferase-like glycosyltransferase